jgi:hypothetical protein
MMELDQLKTTSTFFNTLLKGVRGQKLLIIGAGCSKNYSQCNSEIQGLECPLDNDFFRMAKKVLLSGKVEPNLLLTIQSGLIYNLQMLYGYEPDFGFASLEKDWINTENGRRSLDFFDDKRLSLEKVMTQLSLQNEVFQPIPSLYGYPRKGNSNDYDDSLATLFELVAVTIEEALKGPVCEEHLKLANSLAPGDAVISFNYDLLMDNALRQSGKLTDAGYFLPFHKVIGDTNWESPQNLSSSVSLLKLHGSLNWLHCSYCNSYLLSRSEKMGAWYSLKPKNCPICGESNTYLERVIVPPLLAKDYSIHPLKYLWNRAIRHIAASKEIIIIGYSFPPTDFGTEALLRWGLLGGFQKRLRFVVVNPEEAVYKRVKETFSSSTVVWKKTLAEYFETI